MASIFSNLGNSSQSQPPKPGGLFSSLTASPAQNQPPGGGLFSNLNTSQPQASGAGGLFGSNSTAPAQSQAPGSSSLFGNLATSQAPQQSSLFGKPPDQPKSNPFGTTPQPAQQGSSSLGGLFGRVEPSKTQAQSSAPSGGLFGSLQAPNSQPAQASSLFGAPTSTQNQQNQTQQQAPAPASTSQPGYFDNLLERGKKRHREYDGSSSFQELPSLQLNLNDIAKRARELGNAESHGGSAPGVDSSAHYLLAASGVNLGNTRKDLESLAGRSFEKPVSSSPAFEPDTHKFLEQLQEQATTKMLADALDRAHRKFDEYIDESVDINWENQRNRIYHHFGLVPRGDQVDDLGSAEGRGAFGKTSRRPRTAQSGKAGQSTLNRSLFGQSSVQKSVIGDIAEGSGSGALFTDVAEKTNGSAPQDDHYVREKQRRYAEKIQALNQARLKLARSREGSSGPSYPLIKELQSVEGQPGGDAPKQLLEAFQALAEIVEEPKAKERQFADDYLEENPTSTKTSRIRRRIIDGSRRSLEKAFYEQVTSVVAKNPKEANIGGVPTAINKVRAYVRIRVARKDLVSDSQDLLLVNGDYAWPLVFFCLRCGLVKEAADFVTENAVQFRTVDKNIITYLANYASHPDRRLDRKLQPLCNNVYTSLSKADSVDPYRVACYKIIGRCDLTKRNLDNISQGVEDWIWLQFCLAREVNRAEESAGDVFGLEEVQETIQEIGQRHFAKGAEGTGGYGTYFLLQILGGMFEQAVAYLYSYSYVAAVHFAIALDYYGLLRVSDFSSSESDLLTHNTKEMPQISFGRMIGYYTRDFRTGDVDSAVDYLSLICLNADLPGSLGTSQASLCHEALRELVLETREFARLLGDIRPDGNRLKGQIEDHLEIISLSDEQSYLQAITVEAASVADDNGRTTDAVLLYHLSESYDNVIVVINRALSEAIAVDIGADEIRLQTLKPRREQDGAHSSLSLTAVDDPVTLAKNMMNLYNHNPLYFRKINAPNREACGVLLRMSEAKTRVASGDWAGAIDTINALGLLPLSAEGSIPAIRASANAFNSLPATIARNVGPLLLWTITAIGRQREVLSTRAFGGGPGGTNKQMCDHLTAAARDLMVFAGLLKYRLGERVWEAVCGVGGEVGV